MKDCPLISSSSLLDPLEGQNRAGPFRRASFIDLVDEVNEHSLTIVGQQLSKLELERVVQFSVGNHAEKTATPIQTKALIITGPPRSGTSTLQLLLSLGCGWRSPSGVSLAYGRSANSKEAGQMIRQATLRAALVRRANPGGYQSHRIPIRQADECSIGLLNYIWGVQPLINWSCPQYLDRLMTESGSVEYSHYFSYLVGLGVLGEGLGCEAPLPAVLKAPGHELFIRTISELLPNAVFIRVKRADGDREKSWLNLVRSFRHMFGHPSSARDVGFWGDIWAEGAARFTVASFTDTVEIRFEDVVHRPFAITTMLASAIGAPEPDRARVERTARLLRRVLG